MRRTTTVVVNQIRFIGHIWQGQVCAKDVVFPEGRREEWNREAIASFLSGRGKGASKDVGDFQDIIDFECDFSEGRGKGKRKDWKSPWEKEENELTYNDCMFQG